MSFVRAIEMMTTPRFEGSEYGESDGVKSLDLKKDVEQPFWSSPLDEISPKKNIGLNMATSKS